MLAFIYFKEQKVDFAVLETGLGGKLDATNIVKPLISVITSVGYDHCHILGNTIEQIAFEKAGIIKQNKPVVFGTELPIDFLTKIAKQRSSPIITTLKANSLEETHQNIAEFVVCT